MALPGLLYFLVFHYLPFWGFLAAFKDFKPYLGLDNSPWIGFENFTRLFQDPGFWKALGNSLIINSANLAFFFPVPIVLALMLNEVRGRFFKRAIQTVVYMPHFLSWVTVYSIVFLIFSNQGILSAQLRQWNLPPIPVLTDPGYFRPVIILQQIWRDSGWGTIIILAALTGINGQLYEAAMVDGANRWQQFRYVTLPGIRGVILVLLVLRLGDLLRVGFEQIYVMQNSLNFSVSDVLETYSFRTAIMNGDFGYGTAIGMFQSVVAFVLVICANWLVTRSGEDGIW